jgi:hypothetical protein
MHINEQVNRKPFTHTYTSTEACTRKHTNRTQDTFTIRDGKKKFAQHHVEKTKALQQSDSTTTTHITHANSKQKRKYLLLPEYRTQGLVLSPKT